MRSRFISGAIGAFTLAALSLPPQAHAADSGQRVAPTTAEPRATAGTIEDAKDTILQRYRDLLRADPDRFCLDFYVDRCHVNSGAWLYLSDVFDFSAEATGDPDLLDEPVVVGATPQELLSTNLKNPNSGPLLMTSAEEHRNYTNSSTSSTTHGFGISGGGTAEVEIPLDGDAPGGPSFGGTLDIKYDFSTTNSQTHSESHTVIIPRQTVMVPGHSTAHVYAILSRVKVDGLLGQELIVSGTAGLGGPDDVIGMPERLSSARVMSPWDYNDRYGQPMNPGPEGWHPMFAPEGDYNRVDNVARFDGYIGVGLEVLINCSDNLTGQMIDCSDPGSSDGPLRLDRFVTSPGTSESETFIAPETPAPNPESNLPRTAFEGARMKLEAAGGVAPYRYQVTGPATVSDDILTITGPGAVDVQIRDAVGNVVHYAFHPAFFEAPGGLPATSEDAAMVCRQNRAGSVVPPSDKIHSNLQERHSGALVNEWGDPEKNDAGWILLNTFSDAPYAGTSTVQSGWPLAAPLTLHGGHAVQIAGWQFVNVVCMTPAVV